MWASTLRGDLEYEIGNSCPTGAGLDPLAWDRRLQFVNEKTITIWKAGR